jgi:methyl-accepting chemotaxis protein
VKKVSAIVADIATASQEQSAGIDQVNRAVAQMEAITEENAGLVEKASASSQHMALAAGDLERLISRYRIAQTGSTSDGADTVSRAA